MEIVVTGATGTMGRRLVPLLRGRGHRVTVFARETDGPPADHVVPDWMRNPDAADALAGADSIVNLAGNGNPPRGESFAAANAAPAARIRDLVGPAGAGQVVLVSYPGAHFGAASRYLDAKGRAELFTRDAARLPAILRLAMVCGTRSQPLDSDRALLAVPGHRPRVFGAGTARLRPVLISDCVNALAATVENGLSGQFAMEGPDTLTIAEIVRLLNGGRPRLRRIPGPLGLATAPFLGLRRDFLRLMLHDALESTPNVFTLLDLRPGRLAAAWPDE